MHKIFAKTLFLGKNVVFLPQCRSTNGEAKAMNLSHGSVVWTDYQENGKGQQGNVWLSEQGKNLLFTIYLKPDFLAPNDQYLLNLVSSLAIHKVMTTNLPLAKVEIKWPNDIYVNDQKIAGILTEAVISKGTLEHVYSGIGLNVNQTHFNLPTATSMFQQVSSVFDRTDILEMLLLEFEFYYEKMKHDLHGLRNEYEKLLMWRDEIRNFEIGNERTSGILKGIDNNGRLIVKFGSGVQSFDVKEIVFSY